MTVSVFSRENFVHPWDSWLFCKAESSSGVPLVITADDAFKFTGNPDINSGQERLEQKPHTYNRARKIELLGQRKPNGKIQVEMSPSGTAGTPPDIDPILASMFGKKIVSAVTILGGSGVTAPTVNSATVTTPMSDAPAVGNLIPIPVVLSNGIALYRLVVVSNASPVSGGTALTWNPDLPVAPAVGAIIPSSVNYTLQRTPSDTFTLTHLLDDAQFVQQITGGWLGDLAITSDNGKSVVTMDLGIFGREYSQGSRCALGDDMDDVQLTMTIDSNANGLVWFGNDAESTPKLLYKIDNEVIGVVTYDGNTSISVITRAEAGTSAAAHTKGAIITPYNPGQTVNYFPTVNVRGYGAIILGPGESVEVQSENSKLTVNEKTEPHMQEGTAVPIDHMYGEKREVDYDGKLYLTRDSVSLAMFSQQPYAVGLLRQIGDQSGFGFGYAMPQLSPKAYNPVKDGMEIMWNLQGRALATDEVTEDEVVLCYF